MKRFLIYVIGVTCVLVGLLYALSIRHVPSTIHYGTSFSILHAQELGLDWKETYRAILGDLGVRKLRLSALWPFVEPTDGQYDFGDMDLQMNEAAQRGAQVILTIGLRTPGWPECHMPSWAVNLSKAEKQEKQLAYMNAVVLRYKDSPALQYWQVENELFLHFAPQYCDDVDEVFLQKELALVRSLDPKHPIVMTDSGELGRWYKAYQYSDVFATSVYLYIWHGTLGPVRYPIAPGFFRFKENIVEWVFGKKPMILSELGAEPWLSKPIVHASIAEQLAQMDSNRFNEMIEFGAKTGFDQQYLWGAEWWYYMKTQGHPEFWERAKELYK